MIVLCALATAHAADGWFWPGEGPETATVVRDRLGDVPARVLPAVLARVADPEHLLHLPELRALDLLGSQGSGHVVRLTLDPSADPFVTSRKVRQQAGVAWAHPDFILPMRLATLPDDPYLGDQWHLVNDGQAGWTPGVDVAADVAWGLATGAGQVVAVIDTGVDLDHPDLDVVSGWDQIDEDADSSPDLAYSGGPHGTGAAGLAAATGGNGLGVAGVAWGAQIYAIRLVGGNSSLSDVYEAFVDAVDAGASVVSNSWGYGVESCQGFPTWGTLDDAFDYAEENGRGGLGAAVVFAAGNDACDISGDGMLAHPVVVGVAAVDGHDNREWYSSYGEHVDVAAPSGGVLTTDPVGWGYGSWQGDEAYWGGFSGTSAATPIVAGTLALLFEANARLTAAQARQAVCDSAVRVDASDGAYDASGWSPLYGCGRVDAGAAVLAVADGGPPTPPRLATTEALPDLLVLAWEPEADPDGDAITWKVRWWKGDDDREAQVVATTATRLDLTELVLPGERAGHPVPPALEPGDVLSWTVTGSDRWGPGPESPVQRTAIVAAVGDPPADPPRPPTGCAGGAAGLLVLAGWRRLRP